MLFRSGKAITFHRAAQRSCGYVIDTCGDKELDAYTKADANAFRDALVERGLAGSSITRVLGFCTFCHQLCRQ